MDQSGQLCQRIQDGGYSDDGAALGRAFDISSAEQTQLDRGRDEPRHCQIRLFRRFWGEQIDRPGIL